MKYAILSDVHGNAPLLRLALADAAAHGADGYLLAGDYCISAPWANEVLDLLRALPNAHIIRGNDDTHLDVPPGDDGQFEISRWCAAALSPDNKAWLRALPDTLVLDCEGTPLHMAHASSAFVGDALRESFRTSVLPARFPDKPIPHALIQQDFRALWNTPTFRAQIHALEPGVYIFGHNHIQSWADFDGRVLINPGSCGLPLDGCGFGAAYTLLTIAHGQVWVEERRIPCDAEALIGQAKLTAQYRAAPVWSEMIFSEWRTGREKIYFFLRHCEEYARRIGDARRPFARDTWQAAYDDWTTTARDRYPELFVPCPAITTTIG